MIKVCGVTRPEDAVAAAAAGADAIGINLWPQSSRFANAEVAQAVAEAIPEGVLRVGVFVDAEQGEVRRASQRLGLHHVQLHGSESASEVGGFGQGAFKAVRLSSAAALGGLASWPGPFVLVDAYLPGVPGGTGQVADWDLAAEAARRRPVWLAGGLTPWNVAEAIRSVRPYGVDVCSGVESSAGVKAPDLVRAFIEAARAA